MPRRSMKSLWFVGGILGAAGVAVTLDGATFTPPGALGGQVDFAAVEPDLPLPKVLDTVQISSAQIAWTFFENNTQAETGFVNSVDGFPSSTLWDQGSYLMALASANRIGIVNPEEYDRRVGSFLGGLANIELIDAALPNKVYNTRTLQMTDYADQLTPAGIGWSALDIARLLMGLRIIEKQSPEYGEHIRSVLAGWDFTAMSQNGELVGASYVDGKIVELQEGRIGYEQYAARAAALWGVDTMRAVSAERILGWEEVSGVRVPRDLRSANYYKTINPTLSEPYILMALELGLDAESTVLARLVYEAQEARHMETDILTFVSEDHVDAAPYFVYASVFSNATPWAVVSLEGVNYPELRTQSTKATFAWHAIYNSEYTALGMDALANAYDEDRGWYAGVYEIDGELNASLTLNTNAVVLEALHYSQYGPLWAMAVDTVGQSVPDQADRPLQRPPDI